MIAKQGESDEHQQHSDRTGGGVSDSVPHAAPQPAESRRLAPSSRGTKRVLGRALWCAAVIASSACAAKHDGAFKRFVKQGEPGVHLESEAPPRSRNDLHEY